MSIAAGTRLGPYQIGEQLGAGGMGEVYRARDTRLDRSVAIKVVPKHLSEIAELRERFEREARAISSLNHPNICTLHDVGRQDGIDFLVMEFLEGETLSARLERGPLPLAEALEVAAQIADALDKAHRQGVIHRDLKPANVMLTKSGAKLLDFGLARQAQPALSAGNATHSALPTVASHLTAEGRIVGTLQYMAPEQLEGKEADARTDMFAFGAMLYEMVTGKRAFEGKSQVSLIAAIVDHDPPPLSSLQPVSPPLLDHLVQTCLAKNPDRRWQSIADVLIQLRLIQNSGPALAITAKTGRVRQRHVGLAAVAALIAIGVGLAIGLVYPKAVPKAHKVTFEVSTPTVSSPLQQEISPDGSHVVAIVSSAGSPTLWVRSLDQLQGNIIPGTASPQFPFWSANGRFIAFFADGKLKKVDLAGAPPQTLSEAPAGRGGAWNRDDVIVFASSQNGPLFRVSAAGGVPVPVTELDKSRQETAHGHPFFLPDGKHFLYVAVSSKPENSGIYVASLDSKDKKFLLINGIKAQFAMDHLLFMRENALMAQRFDTRRLELQGDPFRVAEQVGFNPANSAAGFSASVNGALALRLNNQGASANGFIRWFDRSGNDLGSAEIQGYLNPVISPDLSHVAVARPEGAGADIWILDLMRRTSTRFTFDPSNDNAPLWSPDGRQIVFQSNRGGTFDLYQKNSSGIDQEQLLLKSDHAKTPLDWSADGRFLLYRDDDPKTGPDLWVLPLTGDKKPMPVVQSPFVDFQGRFSPDGKFIAYVSNEAGPAQVYVQGFPNAVSRWQISTDGGFHPRWRRDGKEIFFMNGGAGTAQVMAVDVSVSKDGALNAGVPRKLFQAAPTGVTSDRNTWDVTPDGQRFLINSTSPREETAVIPLTIILNWRSGNSRSD